jgi:acetyl-CoA carboxylase carboxyl transferase subunit alpha
MSEKTAVWERIELIRHKDRPTVRDYIPMIFDGFMELHGDRLYGDDGAITGGVAWFRGRPVTVIGMVKGAALRKTKNPISPCRSRRATARR